MTLHLGFTGTRHGMSKPQHDAVWNLVSTLYNDTTPLVCHHGDCCGADAEFHAIARFHIAALVVIHPGPENDAHRAWCVADERNDPLPHMQRNRAIVAASSIMIATPLGDEPQSRGGTWKTIGMARRALERGDLRELVVVGRDGQLLDHTKWKRGAP